MPLARYFLFVGGALLALLFVVDAYLPKLPVTDRAEAATDTSVIRIHSDRKWPEPVVFDTSLPTIVPAQTQTAAATPVPAPTTVSDVSAKVRVRDAFAQLPFDPKQAQLSDPKKAEPKLHPKRKIARRRAPPPTVLVAQQPQFGQPQFGFFANNTW
jgi:hypothetical protein